MIPVQEDDGRWIVIDGNGTRIGAGSYAELGGAQAWIDAKEKGEDLPQPGAPATAEPKSPLPDDEEVQPFIAQRHRG